MVERIRNLDLTQTGTTIIFTPSFSGGVFFYITDVFIECTSANGLNNAASISIGTNNPLYNNIIAITPLTGLTASNTFIRIPITLSVPVGRDTDIFVNIVSAAIGTSQSATIFLEGFYA